LTAAQREALAGIAMDMWAPYIQATRARCPDADAKIVFDKFHCAKHLNDGVDRVRRAEHRELLARGDTRLTGTKYRWLRNPSTSIPLCGGPRATAPEHAQGGPGVGAQGVSGEPLGVPLRWSRPHVLPALVPLGDALAPPADIEKARMLKTHLPNILTYLKHRITNATAEGLNSRSSGSATRRAASATGRLQDRDLLPLRRPSISTHTEAGRTSFALPVYLSTGTGPTPPTLAVVPLRERPRPPAGGRPGGLSPERRRGRRTRLRPVPSVRQWKRRPVPRVVR